jgi:hypothetical protein
VFARYLDEPGIPDVDLFVRSSGEQRTSNFLIWQSAYAELVFLDTLFPDFDRRHLWRACEIYASRDRRYGGAAPNPLPALPRSGALCQPSGRWGSAAPVCRVDSASSTRQVDHVRCRWAGGNVPARGKSLWSGCKTRSCAPWQLRGRRKPAEMPQARHRLTP